MEDAKFEASLGYGSALPVPPGEQVQTTHCCTLWLCFSASLRLPLMAGGFGLYFPVTGQLPQLLIWNPLPVKMYPSTSSAVLQANLLALVAHTPSPSYLGS